MEGLKQMKKSYEELEKENEELTKYIEELEEKLSSCQYQYVMLEKKLKETK